MATKKDLEAAADYFAESDAVVEGTANASSFIKLKDGESVVIAFAKKKPLSFKQVWINDQNRSEIYDEDKHDGMRPSGRHLFSVVDINAGLKPSVLECANGVYDIVKSALVKYGFASSFEFIRKGTGTDTEYRLMLEEKLDEDQYAAIEGVEHIDLDEVLAAKSSDTQSKGEPSRKEKKANPWEKK